MNIPPFGIGDEVFVYKMYRPPVRGTILEITERDYLDPPLWLCKVDIGTNDHYNGWAHNLLPVSPLIQLAEVAK